MVSPSPGDVRRARKKVKLTMAAAAKLVYLSGHARWAEYESGKRNMDPARWELFLIKTGQFPREFRVGNNLVIPVFF